MKWNQVFCRHIYKQIKVECLSPDIIYIDHFIGSRYREYAITKQCLKCNKTNIKKEKLSV